MDRLSYFLTMMTWSALTGVALIAVLSLGYYTWWAIVGAIVVGTLLAWPVAYGVSRWIKREDPSWDKHKGDNVNPAIPDPGAPEV